MNENEVVDIKSAKKRTNVDGLITPLNKIKGKPHRFAPGNNANPAGRPKGSRNKLQENAIAMLNKIFEEPNNEEKMRELRDNDYGTFLKCVVSLVPKQVEVGEAGAFSDMTVEELQTFISIGLESIKEEYAVH